MYKEHFFLEMFFSKVDRKSSKDHQKRVTSEKWKKLIMPKLIRLTEGVHFRKIWYAIRVNVS